MQHVLEPMGWRGLVVLPRRIRDGKREQDAGDRRMDAGLQHQEPHQRPAQQIGKECHDAGKAVQADQRAEHGQGADQVSELQVGRIEQRDDQDGAQIVDDGKRGQEDLERSRYILAEQGQHSQCESDVGGHRNPHAPLRRRTRIQAEVQQSRDADTADCGNNRQQGIAEVGQLPVVQFALEFEAHHQEEHCHQAIIDPVFDAHAGDFAMPERQIARAGRGIRQQQRQEGTGDENDAACLLGGEKALEGAGQAREGADACVIMWAAGNRVAARPTLCLRHTDVCAPEASITYR